MNDKSEVLSITFMEQSLKIKTTPEHTNTLQNAAELLDSKLQQTQKEHKVTSSEQASLLAGLSLAYELLYLQNQIQKLKERLEQNLQT